MVHNVFKHALTSPPSTEIFLLAKISPCRKEHPNDDLLPHRCHLRAQLASKTRLRPNGYEWMESTVVNGLDKMPNSQNEDIDIATERSYAQEHSVVIRRWEHLLLISSVQRPYELFLITPKLRRSLLLLQNSLRHSVQVETSFPCQRSCRCLLRERMTLISCYRFLRVATVKNSSCCCLSRYTTERLTTQGTHHIDKMREEIDQRRTVRKKQAIRPSTL